MYHQGVRSGRKKIAAVLSLLLVAAVISAVAVVNLSEKTEPAVKETVSYQLEIDDSVSPDELTKIQNSLEKQGLAIKAPVTASVAVTSTVSDAELVSGAFLAVTHFNSAKQNLLLSEITIDTLLLPASMSEVEMQGFVDFFDIQGTPTTFDNLEEITENTIAIIPAENLTGGVKLLALEGAYYLDEINAGALYRQVSFSGDGASDVSGLQLNSLADKADILTINMTGVTALTRGMMKRLSTTKDPLYFSEKIGEFLADADLTHVSNEVSFRENCSYSNTSFCSPPEFIETLKASGVDIVELTGNHNNDNGSQYNTETINQYHSLGWATVGGGLNSEEAAKPFIASQKGSTIAFLAYNYADSPGSGALAGSDRAGANGFDVERAAAEIQAAKQSSDFVIVDIQYWECYAYPDGYVEYPICDKPIGEQENAFKKLIDLGADMVIGTQAHQPQTYVLYNGKPIYYGLGNLYFDQSYWPGTERGIVLTHYFKSGTLLQTKLTPTIYDKDLQTRIATEAEADYLLNRLKDAR